MKNTLPYLAIASLLAACGATTPADDLGKKRIELDSLKTAYKETGERIKDLDSWITEHDTAVKKNLPSVTTLVLRPSTFEHFVQVHGVVKADQSADLYSTGGRVRRVMVHEGDRVNSGQLLIDLDNDAISKQLNAAKAGAQLAKEVCEKQAKLWEQKIGSEIQYLQAKSQNDQAQASVAALEEQVRLSNVTAPFSGIVDRIMVSEGDMTSPMAAVARVVNPSGARLDADVPESYLKSVKAGDPVMVEFPSLNDTMSATLTNVSRYIDRANRTFSVSVRMNGADDLLRPNLLSIIHVRDQVQDSALVVPSRMIQEDVSGKSYVFVLDEKDGRSITRKVMVERLAAYKSNTMVKPTDASMTLVGSTLVDEGAKSVGNGQEVKVTKQ